MADPEGSHLLLLARGPDGYRALCRTVSVAQMRGKEKGRPVYDLDEVVAETAGQVLVLTGCRKGSVAQALRRGGRDAAKAALRGLVERFGAEHVAVELTDHGLPTDHERCAALAKATRSAGGVVVNVRVERPGVELQPEGSGFAPEAEPVRLRTPQSRSQRASSLR